MESWLQVPHKIVSRHYFRRAARRREAHEERDQATLDALTGQPSDRTKFQTVPAPRGPARYWVVERL